MGNSSDKAVVSPDNSHGLSSDVYLACCTLFDTFISEECLMPYGQPDQSCVCTSAMSQSCPLLHNSLHNCTSSTFLSLQPRHCSATCATCAGSHRGSLTSVDIIFIINAFRLLMCLVHASLVSPEQFVLCIPICPTNTTSLTVLYHNTIETRPRATRWVQAFDFTKQKLLKQCIIRHPENMT